MAGSKVPNRYRMAGVAMKMCEHCGVPQPVSRDHVWRGDGTISLRENEQHWMAIFEKQFFDDFTESLATCVGEEELFRAMSDGMYLNAKQYTSTVMKGPLGRLARSQVGGRKVYTYLLDSLPALGLGRFEIEEYRKGEHLTGRGYHPYSIPCLVGDIWSFFEIIERRPAIASHMRWPDSIEVSVSADKKGGPKVTGKLRKKKRVTGMVDLDRCPRCGIPMDMARLRWDTDKGTITDTRSRERVFMLSSVEFEGMWKRMEDTFGDVVWRTFTQANIRQGERLVENGIVRDMDDLMSDLLFKGMGHGTTVNKDTAMILMVRNHFNKYYIEGRAVGVFKALNGSEPALRRVLEMGSMELTIRPSRP